MFRKLIFYWVWFFCTFGVDGNSGDMQSVVTVPVADVTRFSLQNFMSSHEIENYYNSMSLCPHHSGEFSCLRYHQLLFNEIVLIQEEKGCEVACKLLNICDEHEYRSLGQTVWTQKKYLKPINECAYQELIPPPFSFTHKNQDNYILTLTLPWFDEETEFYYSVGTRFIYVPQLSTQRYYAIALNDYEKNYFHIGLIPSTHAFIKYPSRKEALKRFIALIKQWTKQQGFSHYVWGGCSLIDYYEEETSYLMHSLWENEMISYWFKPLPQHPATGFDCSGLILRAAQICGMPYYLKNTYTLIKYLKPLSEDELLQEGDLIWYEGHVIVMSDIKKNTIIESVGHPLGYGKLLESPLSQIFSGIQTYEDLIEAHHNKESLIRLDKDGNQFRYIENFSILKMNSLWD